MNAIPETTQYTFPTKSTFSTEKNTETWGQQPSVSFEKSTMGVDALVYGGGFENKTLINLQQPWTLNPETAPTTPATQYTFPTKSTFPTEKNTEIPWGQQPSVSFEKSTMGGNALVYGGGFENKTLINLQEAWTLNPETASTTTPAQTTDPASTTTPAQAPTISEKDFPYFKEAVSGLLGIDDPKDKTVDSALAGFNEKITKLTDPNGINKNRTAYPPKSPEETIFRAIVLVNAKKQDTKITEVKYPGTHVEAQKIREEDFKQKLLKPTVPETPNIIVQNNLAPETPSNKETKKTKDTNKEETDKKESKKETDKTDKKGGGGFFKKALGIFGQVAKTFLGG